MTTKLLTSGEKSKDQNGAVARNYLDCMRQFPKKVYPLVSDTLLHCQSPFMGKCLTEKLVLTDNDGKAYAFCLGPQAISSQNASGAKESV